VAVALVVTVAAGCGSASDDAAAPSATPPTTAAADGETCELFVAFVREMELSTMDEQRDLIRGIYDAAQESGTPAMVEASREMLRLWTNPEEPRRTERPPVQVMGEECGIT
jgi:nitrous oxide reductase accessory protein NosL